MVSAVFPAVLSDLLQEIGAIVTQLVISHTDYHQQLLRALRPVGCHGCEGGVAEDNERRHPLGVGQPLAQAPQYLEKPFIVLPLSAVQPV
jgi:hypothetical protein